MRTLLISSTVCPVVCPLGLVVVWVIGYRGGGGRTLWISMLEMLCASQKARTYNMLKLNPKLKPSGGTLRRLQVWWELGRDSDWSTIED